ncbi:MAG: tRNA (N(6)-L-threonylcarbamoyladenosine(37)-C(2))-methylthiotransferase [Fervidicoccaceae archaeon]
MRSYYIETYGCTLNKTDSALIEARLRSAGYISVDSIDKADIIIINTCTVRLDTEERMLRRIKELCIEGKKLIVTGCLASAQPAFVKSECKDAIVLDNMSISLIHLYLNGGFNFQLGEKALAEKALNPVIHREGPILSVPLADGCLDNCSYCITKLARPNLLSRKPDKVIEKLRETVSSLPYEVVEVQLTGQDLAVYGYDIVKKPLLPSLLESIFSIDYGGKLLKIRLGMMTPNWFKFIMNDIVEIMKNDQRVYRFLHLPVQSGDDRVLRLMRRRYSVSEFKQMVEFIRREIEDVQIATDIIVGHPGEDELAFQKTLELLQELRIERVHIAQYTPRPHTLSARMKQLTYGERKRRSLLINKIYEEIGYEWHSKLVGRRVKAYLVERFRWKGQHYIVGRTDNYVSIVVKNATDKQLGKIADVCIDEATFYDVRGHLC